MERICEVVKSALKNQVLAANSCTRSIFLFKYEDFCKHCTSSFSLPQPILEECWVSHGLSSLQKAGENVFGLLNGAQLTMNHKWMCNF